MRKQVNLLVFAMLTLFLGVACGEETSSVPKTSEEREKLMREALQGTELKRIREQLIANEEEQLKRAPTDSSSKDTKKDSKLLAQSKTDNYIEQRIKEIAAPNRQTASGLKPPATPDLYLSGVSSNKIDGLLVKQKNSLNTELDYYLIRANNGW